MDARVTYTYGKSTLPPPQGVTSIHFDEKPEMLFKQILLLSKWEIHLTLKSKPDSLTEWVSDKVTYWAVLDS